MSSNGSTIVWKNTHCRNVPCANTSSGWRHPIGDKFELLNDDIKHFFFELFNEAYSDLVEDYLEEAELLPGVGDISLWLRTYRNRREWRERDERIMHNLQRMDGEVKEIEKYMKNQGMI